MIVKEKYILKDAIIFNPTGKKYNAVAKIATIKEIRQHKEYFNFNFEKNYKEATIYKITKEHDEDLIQGFVSVKPNIGVLDCGNMETNKINKSPLSLHGGIGKSIIALCCKISFDCGLDGYITFEAKTNLFSYYARYGAKKTVGLRMFMDTIAAQKLVDIYF
jgi:hypothetical protein